MVTAEPARGHENRFLTAVRRSDTGLRSAGVWQVFALALVAGGAATAFGFWEDEGHRLLKLEAALGLATVGLTVVSLASMVRLSDEVEERLRGETLSTIPLLRLAVALLSGAAALVHFAVIKQHIDEYWLYGAFFVVVGTSQLAWALLVLWWPSQRIYWVGAVGNAAIVVFFVITRTVGPLIGPEAGHAAQLGFGDTATTAYEALIVALSLLLVLRAQSLPSIRARAIAGGSSLLTLLLVPQTALALQSAITSAPFVPHVG